jgi:diguanylate cyclase (GGDEF)-like protein/PAS domain S-box-containing protein
MWSRWVTRTYSMRFKLVITFLLLVILLSAAFIGVTYQTIVSAITSIATQNLHRAASHTAAELDGFILTNLELVQIASQLETVHDYLNLPPESRYGSSQEQALLEDLKNLSLQNSQYPILSIGILGSDGKNLQDIDRHQINIDESQTLYFQNALSKQGAVVSPVMFMSKSNQGDLYFIAPVYGDMPANRRGFVRTRLSGVSLQTLVYTGTQQQDDQVGAILLDENGLQLANDLKKKDVFKTLTSLPSEKAAFLLSQGRLPQKPLGDLSSNSDELSKSLNSSDGQNGFATTIMGDYPRRYQAVVKGMDTMPWRLVLVQPYEIFLAPIWEYTRRLVWVTVLISLGAIAVSAGVARWLSAPILRLTEVTHRVSQGDFTARVEEDSKDEIGILAKTFNIMTARLQEMMDELEVKVEKSEARYRDVVNGQSELICRFLPDFTITFTNEAYSRFYGIPTGELINESIFLFIMEEERSIIKDLLAKLEPEYPVVAYEQRTLNALGEETWLQWSATGIYTRDRDLNEIQLVGREVTQQRRAENALREREARLSMITDQMIDVVMERDLGGVLRYVSPSCQQLLGYTPDEMINHPIHEFVHPEDYDQVKWINREAAETLTVVKTQYRFWHKDGHYIWVESAGKILVDNSGKPIGGVFNIRDITERMQAEQALKDVNQHLTQWVHELREHNQEFTLLNEMGDMLQSTNSPEEAYSVIHQYIESLFLEQAGALYIRSEKQDLLEAVITWGVGSQNEIIITSQDCWALRRGQIHQLTSPEERLSCTHYKVSKNRDAFRPSLCIPLMAQGEVIGLLHLSLKPDQSMERYQQLGIMVADRTALALANIKLQSNLRQQSIRDPLTGLFNRQYMQETLEREMRRAVRHKRGLAVIVADIDHFKKFNDTYSYSAGDVLLQDIGKLLHSNLRGGDVVCRYGGEEFVIILPESSLDHSMLRAEQLRQIISETRISFRGISLGQVTISIGLACFPENGTEGDELLRKADIALHRAKNEGRNRVVYYRSSENVN